MENVNCLILELLILLLVENVKITIPLISKDGRERESKTGELKVFVNGTIERTRRGFIF